LSSIRHLAITLAIAAAGALYAPIKLLPTRNRVTIISRQSNSPSLDIRYLVAALERLADPPEVVVLTRRLEPGLADRLGYILHILHQMVSVATSKVLVLDTYSIVASVLSHKRSLHIVQMWHATGAFKKFGLSTVGQPDGADPDIARLMRMHQGYHTVVASGPAAVAPFAESLGTPEERVVVCPLPRFDFLRDGEAKKEVRRRILAAFPELVDRKVLLFAPTLGLSRQGRTSITSRLEAIAEEAGFALISSFHPVQERRVSGHRREAEFSTLEWLTVAQVFVTDRSSLIFEAAYLGLGVHVFPFVRPRPLLNDSSHLDRDLLDRLMVSDAGTLQSRIVAGRDNSDVAALLRERYLRFPSGKSCSDELAALIAQRGELGR